MMSCSGRLIYGESWRTISVSWREATGKGTPEAGEYAVSTLDIGMW